MKLSATTLATAILLTTACSEEKKFAGNPQPKGVAQPAVKETANIEGNVKNEIAITLEMEGKLAKPFQIKEGSLDVSFPMCANSSIEETENVRPPLDISFVLDTTGSMGAQLKAAKNSYSAFIDRLKADGFDARSSLITFDDTAFVKTSYIDFSMFQPVLSKAEVWGGADVPEASLGAISLALTDGAMNKRAEAKPILILVTDAVGHQGGSAIPRDCSIDKVVSDLSSGYGKDAIFLYSAPDSTARDCNVNKIDEQYKTILEKIKTGTEYRGESLGWPFKDETLTTVLPNLLKEKVVVKKQVCDATHFTLSGQGGEIAAGPASALSKNSQGDLSISEVAKGKNLDALVGQELSLEINRCCDEVKSEVCKDSKVQSVQFILSK